MRWKRLLKIRSVLRNYFQQMIISKIPSSNGKTKMKNRKLKKLFPMEKSKKSLEILQREFNCFKTVNWTEKKI